jgi:hypothetical protein
VYIALYHLLAVGWKGVFDQSSPGSNESPEQRVKLKVVTGYTWWLVFVRIVFFFFWLDGYNNLLLTPMG